MVHLSVLRLIKIKCVGTKRPYELLLNDTNRTVGLYLIDLDNRTRGQNGGRENELGTLSTF